MNRVRCDICGRPAGIAVGSGYSSSPALTIRWCGRANCIVAARARRAEAEKRPRLHFVSKASNLIGALALPAIHILDRKVTSRTICGVLLRGRTIEFQERFFKDRGCRSCERMRGSAEKRLVFVRSPAPASSLLSNRRPGRAARRLSNRASSAPSTSSAKIAREGFRIEHDGKVTLQQKRIRCGKRGCDDLHGPYWYAYFKVDGRTRCRYIGRELPVALERDPSFTIAGLRSVGPYRVRACCGGQPNAAHLKGCTEASK